jgi:hypothetical protein
MYDPEYLLRFLREGVAQEVARRFGVRPDDVPPEDLLAEAGRLLRRDNESEPHRVLASLPLPVYITTNYDRVLEDALADVELRPGVRKDPRFDLCRWNEEVDWERPVPGRAEPGYEPTPQQPLVYHLFGRLDFDPYSVVLTEDDYFSYLIGVSRTAQGQGAAPIPPNVRKALTNTSLMFLGFQMDEWAFRVLFTSFMDPGGRVLRRRFTHVSVQVDPEGSPSIDPERAKKYLEKVYTKSDLRLDIYWGKAEDFARELLEKWSARAGAGGAAGVRP